MPALLFIFVDAVLALYRARIVERLRRQLINAIILDVLVVAHLRMVRRFFDQLSAMTKLKGRIGQQKVTVKPLRDVAMTLRALLANPSPVMAA